MTDNEADQIAKTWLCDCCRRGHMHLTVEIDSLMARLFMTLSATVYMFYNLMYLIKQQE